VQAKLQFERKNTILDIREKIRLTLEAQRDIQQQQLEQQKAIRAALEKSGADVATAEELGS
jgi:hypothetical protein